MATADERMQILRMIENRQISAEEGARLLAALEDKPAAELPPPHPRKRADVGCACASPICERANAK